MDKIKKKEIIEHIAKEAGLPLTKSKLVLETVIDFFKENLENEKEILLKGFGKFKVETKKATKRKIFGKERYIPERKKVKFIPSKNIINKE